MNALAVRKNDLKKQNRALKSPVAKKLKRFNPYDPIMHDLETLNESQLLETPVREAKDIAEWALVASPNKPPGHK